MASVPGNALGSARGRGGVEHPALRQSVISKRRGQETEPVAPVRAVAKEEKRGGLQGVQIHVGAAGQKAPSPRRQDQLRQEASQTKLKKPL